MKFQVVITGPEHFAPVVTKLLHTAQTWFAGTGVGISYRREDKA